ncbi:MAG: ferrous iron transport protein A [Clostridiales bacterium]|nr:ferrous iron transport protein A [Lachnospiraceae bacterium]MCD7923035.1 ferrous iron transport protein A [Clostridiales bacterium]MCD8111033.1 ferrous iron transport protein A [Clostridiales bacterium]
MQALSSAAQGVYTIQWMFGVPEILDQLHDWEICEGSVIRVITKYRDAVMIGNGDRRFILENEVAERIRV